MAQPEDFTAGTIRPARPFRAPSPSVAGDEKRVESAKDNSENRPLAPLVDEPPIEPIQIPIASTPLRSELEAERKRKHAEALKKELEAMEKRIVQRKEDALREARQKRSIMFQEEAALVEAERRSVAADKDAEEKRLVAEKADTVKNEEAAQRAQEASIQADVEEEAAASRAQKAEEEAYDAQRRSEKAQQEEDEFRRKAKKELEEARRQAQEYADKARLERNQAEQEAETSNRIDEAKKETHLEEVRIEKQKTEAQEEAKPQREALVEKIKKQDETTKDKEQKEMLGSPASVNAPENASTETATDLGVTTVSDIAFESIAPLASPVAASSIRLASSDLGRAALPFAAIIGGAVFLRNNRIKRELEMHVELRELSKERIGELAQEETNRINVS